MTGRTYHGTYTTTILLTDTVQQNPATLTGTIAVNGTNASSDSGFYSSVGFSWSLFNQGSIDAAGVTSYGIALLGAGGTIQNGALGSSSGMIRSDETGIFLTGGIGTVTNDGTIIGAAGRGVFLQDGGTLTNAAGTATIDGGFVGVAIYNAGGSLTNAGTIENTGTAGLGVQLYAGNVVNQAGAQIGGVYGVGFVAHAMAGTLTNAGTIIGTVRDGVEMSGGGKVTNNGSIGGAVGGVLALYGTVDLSNTGVITGAYAGVDLLPGGAVNNHATGRISGGFGVSIGNGNLPSAVNAVANAGTIMGSTYQGVSLNNGGSVTNSGSIYGRSAGVAAFYGAATVSNTGAISSSFAGVDLAAGGTITNAASATITGSYGIVLANGAPQGTPASPSSLMNAGQITGTGTFGADLLTNGTFVNQAGGTISGGRYGVYLESASGTISNYGVITGQTGVYSRAVVANGTRYPAAITIVNAGTIIGTGGVAVSMFASNDLLIDHPGAVFGGGVIAGGGSLELAAGGVGTIGSLAAAIAGFSQVTEDAGGVWGIAGTLASTGTLSVGGKLTISGSARFLNRGITQGIGGATGTIALSHGGTLASSGTIASNMLVRFDDGSGHLTLTTPLADHAATAGFAPGDTLYLPNIALAGLAETYAGDSGSGTLTLTQAGTTVASLALLGTYTTSSFVLAGDPSGGADVLIPCFAAGTRIATAEGARRVERLRPGGLVLTAGGALRPIVWIGQRAVDIAGHADPASVRPVQIAAGAFGPGRPERDLLLSPDHAVLYRGGLIPAHLLVNGRSVQLGPIRPIRYFHVELPSHDILLAEGLEVESYLDTGNRSLFGRDAYAAPAAARTACVPLVLGGPALARVRRHLAVQPSRRCEPAGSPPVTVLVDGTAVAPVARQHARLLFLLPADARAFTLTVAQPCWLAGIIVDGLLFDGARQIDTVATFKVQPSSIPRSLELALGRSSVGAYDPRSNLAANIRTLHRSVR